MGDLQIKATGCYNKALALLQQAEYHYIARGDKEQTSCLWEMRQDISQRIGSQIPTVYVDGKQYKLVPTKIASKVSSNLPSGVHCWAVMIGGDAGKEYGIVSGDGILIYILEPIKDPEHPPMAHTDSKIEAKFRRDAQGRIWYIPPGGDESQERFVDAVLKPED